MSLTLGPAGRQVREQDKYCHCHNPWLGVGYCIALENQSSVGTWEGFRLSEKMAVGTMRRTRSLRAAQSPGLQAGQTWGASELYNTEYGAGPPDEKHPPADPKRR